MSDGWDALAILIFAYVAMKLMDHYLPWPFGKKPKRAKREVL